MKPSRKNFWQIAPKIIGWGALGIIILFIVTKIILAGYLVSWTGFGGYTTTKGDIVREKTLWDWMQLLVIPLVLAIGAFFLNRSEHAVERRRAEDRAKLEREIATDRQQEAALQSYIDRMAELLLKDNLKTTKKVSVRDVARTRTLTVLRGLDPKRKGLVIKFLYEAGLIFRKNCVIDLEGADLNFADLQSSELFGANLSRANMENANFYKAGLGEILLEGTILLEADFSDAVLQNASLAWADLTFANLSNADLSGANLLDAKFNGANLSGAFLIGTDLSGADFSEVYLEIEDKRALGYSLPAANLTGANVTKEQLATAKSLKGATMPDGTKHE